MWSEMKIAHSLQVWIFLPSMSMESENWDITKEKIGIFSNEPSKWNSSYYDGFSIYLLLQQCNRVTIIFFILSILDMDLIAKCITLSCQYIYSRQLGRILFWIWFMEAQHYKLEVSWPRPSSFFAHRHRVSPVSSWYWIKFKYQSH